MNDEKPTLSEDEIDELVTAHAEDDSAWEPPIHVSRNQNSTESPDELKI